MTAAKHRLSLAEWLVLCLICEAPTHGFAITRMLAADGELGQVWRVPKPVIYRALQRLESLGLVRTVEVQPSSAGPARSLIDATSDGRAAATDWLARPVTHNRDIRSELLVKLALLDRAGANPDRLLEAQHRELRPLADALQERLAQAAGFDRTVTLWRCETVAATLRFLDAVREPVSSRPS